jgi:predicted small secreted protein
MFAAYDFKRVSSMAVIVLACVLLVAAALLLAGCQTGDGATHSVMNETSFYLDGPQQARPPDGVLAGGTAVTLVEASGSYALVRLPDDRRAYVAADSLAELR